MTLLVVCEVCKGKGWIRTDTAWLSCWHCAQRGSMVAPDIGTAIPDYHREPKERPQD